MGVPLGTNVTLGCIVESSPKSINVWYKDGNVAAPFPHGLLRTRESYRHRNFLFCETDKMIANHSRLSFAETTESSYRFRMDLTIQHFRKMDVGRYECRCRNELGEAEGTIKVHGKKESLILSDDDKLCVASRWTALSIKFQLLGIPQICLP